MLIPGKTYRFPGDITLFGLAPDGKRGLVKPGSVGLFLREAEMLNGYVHCKFLLSNSEKVWVRYAENRFTPVG